MIAEQDRGFRELYVKATLSASLGAHELKAGTDVSAGEGPRAVRLPHHRS